MVRQPWLGKKRRDEKSLRNHRDVVKLNQQTSHAQQPNPAGEHRTLLLRRRGTIIV